MIRVFLADDHQLVLVGLRRMIEAEPDMTVVGEAEDGRQVLLAADKSTWDVLVLDLGMPQIGGVEVVRRLRQEVPALRIVVVSIYPEAQYADRLLSLGASAYLAKERPALHVLDAIRAAHEGRTYVGGRGPQDAAPVIADTERAAHATLSAREYQIFMLICQGRSPSEISAELDLAASTVSTHLARIKQKLSARTLAEIMAYAYRAGLLGNEA